MAEGKQQEQAAGTEESSEYTLLYWGGFKGRGEPVRLLMEDQGIAYRQGAVEEIFARVDLRMDPADPEIDRTPSQFPNYAPPVLVRSRDDFSISQLPAVLQFLGHSHGLAPASLTDEAHAMQLTLSFGDYVSEGRSSFHPVEDHASYSTQVEEAKVSTRKWADTRMRKWLQHFQRALGSNNGGEGFFVGDSISYADYMGFFVLDATRNQFPEDWEALDNIPLLKAFVDRMAARPNIAAYMSSDRCAPWAGDSMM